MIEVLGGWLVRFYECRELGDIALLYGRKQQTRNRAHRPLHYCGSACQCWWIDGLCLPWRWGYFNLSAIRPYISLVDQYSDWASRLQPRRSFLRIWGGFSNA